jgi:predicted nucleic acid-binding Zn ribbon protein
VSYCTVCKEEIDEKRYARGSRFCSSECAKAHSKERRDWRASKACRLCGRRLPRPKVKQEESGQLPNEHTVTDGVVTCANL